MGTEEGMDYMAYGDLHSSAFSLRARNYSHTKLPHTSTFPLTYRAIADHAHNLLTQPLPYWRIRSRHARIAGATTTVPASRDHGETDLTKLL